MTRQPDTRSRTQQATSVEQQTVPISFSRSSSPFTFSLRPDRLRPLPFLALVFLAITLLSPLSCAKRAEPPSGLETKALSTTATPGPQGVSEVDLGKSYYLGKKFKCFQCHGKSGKGGAGPSFVGLGKRRTKQEILEKAAHMCPPTRVCSPEELKVIVEYITTL